MTVCKKVEHTKVPFSNISKEKKKKFNGRCHEIFYSFFYLKYFTWAPFEKVKTVSQAFLFSWRFSNVKNVATVYVNTPNNFIFADCSFKVSDRPSKLSVHVHVVIVHSRSQGLQYADIVSAQSMMQFSNNVN